MPSGSAAPADPVLVGRVGRPHGVAGEVTVQVRTDVPERRFAAGAMLRTEPAERGPLTIETCRWTAGGVRLLVRFAGVADRAGAEALRDTLLIIDSADAGSPGDEAWWDHELIGLVAVLADGGEVVGKVRDVIHTGAQDLLAVRRPGGGEALVPFVAEIVPAVDVTGGRVLLRPPDGLLNP